MVTMMSMAAAVGMLAGGLGGGLGVGLGVGGEPAPASEPVAAHADPAYVLDHEVRRIDGTAEVLSRYEGKVVLMVNVASYCGYTPQYEGLQKLYETYQERGLVILGFPANDFGRQEPGSNAEIMEFCESKHGVKFPMFEKITVVEAEGQHSLYKDLASQPAPIGGAPRWNFTKFLVGRDGRVIGRYEPRITPRDSELEAAVKLALEAAAPEGAKGPTGE